MEAKDMTLTALAEQIYQNNAKVGWWDEATPLGGTVPDKYLIPTKLALVHSEVSEALEGYRKNLMDDHLPNFPMFDVELADAIIRLLDLAGYCGVDIGLIVKMKLEYNAHRPDHKREARAAPGGKSI